MQLGPRSDAVVRIEEAVAVQGDSGVIELLNEVLANELTAVLQRGDQALRAWAAGAGARQAGHRTEWPRRTRRPGRPPGAPRRARPAAAGVIRGGVDRHRHREPSRRERAPSRAGPYRGAAHAVLRSH